MKSPKKSLQKLTVSKPKIEDLMKAEIITHELIELYTKAERSQFTALLSDKINTLKGAELDKLLKQIDPILGQNTRNELWESNHASITAALSNQIQIAGRMPTKTELSKETGLSRQTINKHFKEYSKNPEYVNHTDQYRFLTDKILAKLFAFAVQGDVKAAKVYLDYVGQSIQAATSNTLIQNQNNFLQINGFVISQETIKNLNPEQLQQIETIVKMALPVAGHE